jgi:hypothetical protein
MTHLIMFHLPEDEYALECATKGHVYRRALETLRDELRKRTKYDGKPPGSWGAVQDLFFATLHDEEVSLD